MASPNRVPDCLVPGLRAVWAAAGTAMRVVGLVASLLLVGCAGNVAIPMAYFAVSDAPVRVVFVGRGKGGADLYVLETQSKHLSPVAVTPSREDAAAWLPDEAGLVFSSQAPGSEDSSLWACAPDGSHARPVTADKGVQDATPSVSPDGRWVLFSRRQRLDRGQNEGTGWSGWDVYRVAVAGGKPERITTRSQFGPSGPRYCADGHQFVFDGGFLGSGKGVYRGDLVARGQPVEIPLPNQSGSAANPEVSPAGDLLAFISDAERAYWSEVYVSRLSTNKCWPVTNGLACCHTPRFSEDGRWVYFLLQGPQGAGAIMRVLTDATAIEEVVSRSILADPAGAAEAGKMPPTGTRP